MLEALAFALVIMALGFPFLISAMFGADVNSDALADRRTTGNARRTIINIEPQPRRPVASAFEVMAPPLWLLS